MINLWLYISVLTTVMFCGTVANPDLPFTSAQLGRRDTGSFFAAMTTLQNAANVFGADFCCSGTTANVTALELIASHIKACSDAFDASIIQLASITPPLGTSPFSASDAATLNTTFIPSIQTTVLGRLNTLQAGKAFFEFVNNNSLLRVMYCHWVGVLALENNSFLGQLSLAAPSADYASFWEPLQTTAASAYTIWLTEDGFNCRGLF